MIPEMEVSAAENGSRGSSAPVLRFWVESVEIGMPSKTCNGVSQRLMPRECRERGLVYAAPLILTFGRQLNGGDKERFVRRLGDMPIMVGSAKCHLSGKSPRELVGLGEEASEFGGYFICNGIERCVRLLQVPRRNHPMATVRPSFKNRGTQYTEKGVIMRCVRSDQSSMSLTLHYLRDGNVTCKFSLRKQEFLVPIVVLLKALSPISDKAIYDRCLRGDATNTFLSARLEMLLRDAKRWGCQTQEQALAFLGSRFRFILAMSESARDSEVGRELLRRAICVHVDSGGDKQEALLLMLRKLYSFVAGQCAADNADALSNQEILLPGHLYNIFLKEKLDELLQGVRSAIMKDLRTDRAKAAANFQDLKYLQKHFDRQGNIGKKLVYFLNTGNLVSSTGLDLMQVSGYTVVAEKLNWYRYLGHFRAVHRGQFFTQMKTTAVRKLLPESWGFMCPVHTPDGSPCGLLNHLATQCVIQTHPKKGFYTGGNGEAGGDGTKARRLMKKLADLGMTQGGSGPGGGEIVLPHDYLPVVLDGKVLGGAPEEVCKRIARALRRLKALGGDSGRPAEEEEEEATAASSSSSAPSSKRSKKDNRTKKRKRKADAKDDEEEEDDEEEDEEVEGGKDASSAGGGSNEGVDPHLEVVLIMPVKGGGGAYPGLFLHLQPARMIRPVIQLDTERVEYVGPMAQPFMDIAVTPEDLEAKRAPYTHMEVDPTNMLSLVASLTPFSDYNQSPRNMYQCQMGKQTMGTPCHSWPHRADNKMYRIQTPQAPIVHNRRHREYQMDEYPSGTNAVVAVISYTGFDMEDAMILNKSSFERGFGHGSVYKTKVVDLQEERNGKGNNASDSGPRLRFMNPPDRRKGEDGSEKTFDSLDSDGLPPVGLLVKQGDPLYSVVDTVTGRTTAGKHKESEPCYVDEVRLLGKEGMRRSTGSRRTGAEVEEPLQRVSIKLRYCRKPIVGDKFSSRHGQKGVMSILWPQIDMPFTESGMSPDIIINPHAFPSRMTIGMLIESMAGKSGACHGMYQDSTPFQFHEQEGNRAIDYFGEQLRAAGYNYYGSEPLYSGISGTEMHADIFIGVVYYQRLRHMVSDKSQVRATGPVNPVTRQPIKGRKKHGGIRFGEMERDALLSHGATFLLHDRLLNCSDEHIAHVCQKCGSVLSPHKIRNTVVAAGTTAVAGGSGVAGGGGSAAVMHCRNCGTGGDVVSVAMPYVFRYLANELAAMNIKMTLGVKG